MSNGKEEIKQKDRALQMKISEMDAARIVRNEDGSVLIKNIPILTAGIWSDSMQNRPAEYSVSVLRASKWTDNSIWLMHYDSLYRNSLDNVGAVVNPRFDETVNGIVGDMQFHMQSQNSRDSEAMVEKRIIGAGSPEHRARDHFDAKKGHDVIDEIIFTGYALLPPGAEPACSGARFFQKRESEYISPEQEDNRMNDDEKAAIDKRFADFETRLMAKSAEAIGAADKRANEGAETIRKMSATIEEQANKLVSMEKDLGEQKTRAMQGGSSDEVGQPKYNIDLKSGETKRW